MVDWSFQEECLNIMQQNPLGKIILPTGSGKSRIEFSYAKSKLIRNDGVHQIVIVVAPRIILCQQLIKNFYDFVNTKDNSVQEVFTFVSSGKVPPVKINGKRQYVGKSTTVIDEIAHDIKIAKQCDRDNIVFSTYASFDRCVDGVKKALVGGEEIYLLADEAHYFSNCVGESKAFIALRDNANMFANRFFLTATPKIMMGADENVTAMNNEEIYGDDIYTKKPSELIKAGIICEPRLHKVNLPSHVTMDNFDKHAGDFIMKSFRIHEKIINSKCNDDNAEKLGGKILVAVDGSEQLKSLIKNGFVEKARNRGINVAWTMSRDDIGAYFNGKEYPIEDFLLKIKDICFRADGSVKNSTRLIVLHYDQLTEGIDVPSMSGLVVLRSMNKVKKVQNIGRVLRTHPDDHCKDPEFKESWIKPYSYVIVPNFVGVSRFDELIVQLRNEYDAHIEIETPDSAYGLSETEIEMQNIEHKASKFNYISGKIQHNIEEVDAYKQSVWKQINEGGEIDLTF